MNLKAVLALPKTAGSAQIHKNEFHLNCLEHSICICLVGAPHMHRPYKCHLMHNCNIEWITEPQKMHEKGLWVGQASVSWAKPSLKIRAANAIFRISLGMFKDYGLKRCFFRNKTFFVFQDRKLKLLAFLLFTKFQHIQLIQAIAIFIFFYLLSDWVEILWGFTKFFRNRCLKNKKVLFTDPIFSKGFDFAYL